MNKVAVTVLHNFEKKLFWSVVILLLTLGSCYSYFVGKTIVNIVERTKTEEGIIKSQTRVSELEVAYATLKNQITLEKALTLQFQVVATPHYISQSSEEKTLSLKTN